MRCSILGFWAALPLLAQPAPPFPFKQLEQGRVEGLVLNLATNAPVDKVRITLRQVAGSDAAPKSFSNTQLGAMSDAEGRFLIDRVPPGKYVLTTFHIQYAAVTYRSNGDRFINVDPGAVVANLRVMVAGPGSISGRVTGEDGDPLSGARVSVERWMFLNGAWRIAERVSALIDGEGVFHAGRLRAGRYTICAEHPKSEGYVPTYYPSVEHAEEATRVSLLPGTDAAGFNIRMRKGTLFRVQGVIKDPRFSVLGHQIALRLIAQDGAPVSQYLRNLPDGSFEFANVVPGLYVIEDSGVRMLGGGGTASRRLHVQFPVEVNDRDVVGLEIPVLPGVSLTGRITGAGLTPGLTIELRPEIASPLTSPVRATQHDGVFTLPDIEPGRYRINVQNAGPKAFVKSIHAGPHDITNGVLDLRFAAPESLDIQLSPDAGWILAVAQIDDKPAIDATVVLISGDTIRTAKANHRGEAIFQGIAPGDYQLLAFDEPEPGLLAIPEYRAAFATYATSVKVDEKDRITVEFAAVPFAASDLEAAKYR